MCVVDFKVPRSMEFLAVIGALALGYRDDSLAPYQGLQLQAQSQCFRSLELVSYDDEVTQGEK